MAFGFLKKLVDKLIGGKRASSKKGSEKTGRKDGSGNAFPEPPQHIQHITAALFCQQLFIENFGFLPFAPLKQNYFI